MLYQLFKFNFLSSLFLSLLSLPLPLPLSRISPLCLSPSLSLYLFPSISSCLVSLFACVYLYLFISMSPSCFISFLRHPDGSCEVLEVKCHSPFMENRPYNNYNNNNGNNGNSSSQARGTNAIKEGLSISDRGPADSVATWHIPQLQLHILCAGKCYNKLSELTNTLTI